MERDPRRVARERVGAEVRAGRLLPRPCARCGAEPTQAHHADYSRPLEVEWLCLGCHGAVRRAPMPTAPHPIFRIVMVEQGRRLRWLADQTGVSHAYVKAVSAGIERGSPRFRAACARVLGMDERDLFHGNGSSASPSGGTPIDGSDDFRAGSADVRQSVAAS